MEQDRPLLEITDLKTVIPIRSGVITPVDGVSLSIPAHKTVGLVGESGCGKSMTAMSIMGLVPAPGHIESGSIRLGDLELTQIGPKELRRITGDRISIIFQEPMTSLNPVMKVGKQVREAITLHKKISKAEAKAQVVEIFRQVGIPAPERRYHSYPHELSGGLRQRVMIGMAMVCKPDLLIADEPTTALDVTIEAQILHLMRGLRDKEGTSILMITHNLGVVAEICDYVYVMYAGKVVEYAEVFELFRRPLHPYTVGLMDALPSVNRKERLRSIPGTVPSLDNLPAGCRLCTRCERATDLCRTEEPELVDVGGGHLVRCHYCTERGEA